ncbi:MAG: ribosome recycling factor [Phycisphaerales bacterium]|nr:ribosome recycling factor [Phycisphaerales bacterium]
MDSPFAGAAPATRKNRSVVTMDIDEILLECIDRMDKTIEYLRKELRGIRTGRANTALLEFVKVDYYGSSTDLRELAGISVSDSQQLLIKPFDPGAKSDIMKAIELADLGLNPQADGGVIRVNVPSPTSERRQQLVAQVKKIGEDQKVALRNERRDAIKSMEATKNDQKLPEDELARGKDEIEKATKEHVAMVEDMVGKKASEVEEI